MMNIDPAERGFDLYLGNCKEVLAGFPDGSIDAVVSDPPYGLSFQEQKWDYDVPLKETWEEVYRVMKPGAHIVSFFGSRTYHRGATQIEDAGFHIRDCIMWLQSQGFPKSHNIKKHLNKRGGVEFDTMPSNRVGFMDPTGANGWHATKHHLLQSGDDHPDAVEWGGWGTALRPSVEPIALARKPFKGSVTDNVLAHRTGALNIDGCRFNGDMWPPNVAHDGSMEVIEAFAASGAMDAARFFFCAKPTIEEKDFGLDDLPMHQPGELTGRKEGSVGINAYAGAYGKRRNSHPTVKPVALMRWLCRLVTPPGGIVLDPFVGSGTTGVAAKREGFKFIGVDISAEYLEIARRRIEADEWKDTGGQISMF
jgi:DNA modification methylase